MTTLHIDIEAIRDPANPGRDREDGGLQAAPHWRIVAVCAVVTVERLGHTLPDGDANDPPTRDERLTWHEATQAVIFGRGSTDERAILEHVAEAMARRPKLKTWAGGVSEKRGQPRSTGREDGRTATATGERPV